MTDLALVSDDFRQRARLPIRGMTCASCAGRVERALNELFGVSASVNLVGETAEINYDGEVLGPSELVGVIEEAGYEVPHERLEFAIGGMSCASCVGRVEKALARVPGVLKAEVNLAAGCVSQLICASESGSRFYVSGLLIGTRAVALTGVRTHL